MSLLRRVRTELTGAWRSVRYDMGRRPVEPPPGGPDVTSTGMSTFGGFDGFAAGRENLGRERDDQPAAHRRPRRRTLAVTAFGVLTVIGATGAYLGVVNGLGSLLNETPAAADTFPARPAATSTFTPNSGIGQGPSTVVPGSPRTQANGTTPAPGAPGLTPADPRLTGAGAAGAAGAAGTPENTSPIRTTKPPRPGAPPVPTPTAPAGEPGSSGSSGSASPSDSAAPSDSVSPSETSATPSDSAEPSESPQYRRRHRHG
jgi:hypothetical protein